MEVFVVWHNNIQHIILETDKGRQLVKFTKDVKRILHIDETTIIHNVNKEDFASIDEITPFRFNFGMGNNEADTSMDTDEASAYNLTVENLDDSLKCLDVENSSTPNKTAQLLDSSNKEKVRWSHNAIKCLILNYKGNLSKFKDNTTLNEGIWAGISENLLKENFNFDKYQCKQKFASLKLKYTQTKDHNSKTGNDPKYFKYLEDFEEIFVKEHFVEPITRCESSQILNMAKPSSSTSNPPSSSLDDLDKLCEVPLKKRKVKNYQECLLQELKNIAEHQEKREQSREERFVKALEQRKKEHTETLSALKELTGFLNKM